MIYDSRLNIFIMVGKKTRKVLIIAFPIICMLLIALSIYVRSESDLDSTADAASDVSEIIRVTEDPEITGVPRVVSADPLTAREGEQFTYYLEIADSDSLPEEIIVNINEVPDWMSVDKNNFVLSGTPTMGFSDTQVVSLTITDGSHYVEHNFYLLILPKYE